MIFSYVKRLSVIESPFLSAELAASQGMEFLTPQVYPPLTQIPDGTSLLMQYRNTANPSNPSAPKSNWFEAPDVEDNLNTGSYANYDYIQFQAKFEANVDAGTVPSIDTVVLPYKIIE